MAAKLDRVLAALHRSIDTATTASLTRGMHYPTRHYDFHRRQLTLTTPA